MIQIDSIYIHHTRIILEIRKLLCLLSGLQVNLILQRLNNMYSMVWEITKVVTHKDESRDERGGSSESHIKFGGQCIQKHWGWRRKKWDSKWSAIMQPQQNSEKFLCSDRAVKNNHGWPAGRKTPAVGSVQQATCSHTQWVISIKWRPK